MKNTPKKGTFRNIVFKDGDTWYAVALEFNIVESGEEPKLALFNLLQAVDGYIASAHKVRGFRNFDALNQETDKEYEDLWNLLQESAAGNKTVKSPYQIYTYGVTSV